MLIQMGSSEYKKYYYFGRGSTGTIGKPEEAFCDTRIGMKILRRTREVVDELVVSRQDEPEKRRRFCRVLERLRRGERATMISSSILISSSFTPWASLALFAH